SVGLVLGGSRSRGHALGFAGRVLGWRGLPLDTKAERGDPDTGSQNRRKLHSSLQASIGAATPVWGNLRPIGDRAAAVAPRAGYAFSRGRSLRTKSESCRGSP